MKKLVLLLLLLPLHVSAEVLKFYAESLPPYHYTDAKGEPVGALVEIVYAVSRQASIVADVRLLPFARGYQILLSQPNAFMFSLIRTAEREEKVQWVGKIYRSDAYLVGLKNRAELKLNDLPSAKSRVVSTIRGYHSEKFLKAHDFKENQNLYLAVNYETMWSMLFRGRVDYVLTNTVSLDTELTSLGFDTGKVAKYLEVKNFPGELFIVTHLNTSKETVKQLADGLATIKRNGEYQRIIDKWGL